MTHHAPAARFEWMDVLRGVAIVLVVYNHAVLFAGTYEAGAPDVAWVANSVFSPIRMPLLVFLSGLLVAPSLRRGWRRYLEGKIGRVLYPYLVWSVVAIVLLYAFQLRDGRIGGAEIAELSEWDAFRILFHPVEHLWYLYDLFLFYVIALVVPKISPLWIFSGALVVAAFVPEFTVRRFLFLLAFFMLGIWFSYQPGLYDALTRPKWVRWVAAVGCLGVIAAAVLGIGVRYEVESVPLAACAIVLAIVAAQRWGALPRLAPLRAVGRDSLIYYIVHWWATAAGVALGALSGNGWVAIASGLACGLAAGVVTTWIVRVAPVTRFAFEAPPRLMRALRLTAPKLSR